MTDWNALIRAVVAGEALAPHDRELVAKILGAISRGDDPRAIAGTKRRRGRTASLNHPEAALLYRVLRASGVGDKQAVQTVRKHWHCSESTLRRSVALVDVWPERLRTPEILNPIIAQLSENR